MRLPPSRTGPVLPSRIRLAAAIILEWRSRPSFNSVNGPTPAFITISGVGKIWRTSSSRFTCRPNASAIFSTILLIRATLLLAEQM